VRLCRRSPALLRGLAGDVEPGANLGPGVATGAQALDRFAYCGIEIVREAGHEAKSFHIAVCHTSAVGAQDAADERGVLVVLDRPPSPV
jgi:hypothetical protein